MLFLRRILERGGGGKNNEIKLGDKCLPHSQAAYFILGWGRNTKQSYGLLLEEIHYSVYKLRLVSRKRCFKTRYSNYETHFYGDVLWNTPRIKLYRSLGGMFLNTIQYSHLNPYHAEGYSRLVSTSTKRDYSRNCSKCSSTPSGTIVLYWVFGSKIDSRRCYPLFIILYIFLRWGHSFLVYIVPILCHTAKKMKTMKLS